MKPSWEAIIARLILIGLIVAVRWLYLRWLRSMWNPFLSASILLWIAGARFAPQVDWVYWTLMVAGNSSLCVGLFLIFNKKLSAGESALASLLLSIPLYWVGFTMAAWIVMLLVRGRLRE